MIPFVVRVHKACECPCPIGTEDTGKQCTWWVPRRAGGDHQTSCTFMRYEMMFPTVVCCPPLVVLPYVPESVSDRGHSDPLLTDHHSGVDQTEPTTGMDDFKCALMEEEGRRHVPCVGGHSPRGMHTVPLHCPLHTALRMLMAAWGVNDGTSHVVGRSFVIGVTFLPRSGRSARLPV